MIRIGDTNWVNDLMALTAPLVQDFWDDFVPASESELNDVEAQIKRMLDSEFREFYRTVGYGRFPHGGGFDPPEEIILEADAAIYFVTGSLTPGKEWATPQEHVDLWRSRGRKNPNPARFTDEALTFDGVKLYDLLQFGSNGCCCYHQLYVGPEPAPIRYCLLTDYQTMEDRAPTFSDGLNRILASVLEEEGESE